MQRKTKSLFAFSYDTPTPWWFSDICLWGRVGKTFTFDRVIIIKLTQISFLGTQTTMSQTTHWWTNNTLHTSDLSITNRFGWTCSKEILTNTVHCPGRASEVEVIQYAHQIWLSSCWFVLNLSSFQYCRLVSHIQSYYILYIIFTE